MSTCLCFFVSNCSLCIKIKLQAVMHFQAPVPDRYQVIRISRGSWRSAPIAPHFLMLIAGPQMKFWATMKPACGADGRRHVGSGRDSARGAVSIAESNPPGKSIWLPYWLAKASHESHFATLMEVKLWGRPAACLGSIVRNLWVRIRICNEIYP